MSLIDNFDDLKLRLKDKWLDYYEANQSWIASTGIHPNDRVHPYYGFVLGVASTIEPEVAKLIELFARLYPDVDNIAVVLGIYFNPRVELRARAEAAKDIQEAKLLTSGEDDNSEDKQIEEIKVDDLGLDILREEASQLINNS